MSIMKNPFKAPKGGNTDKGKNANKPPRGMALVKNPFSNPSPKQRQITA